MLLQFSYMSVLFVYSRVIVVMNGTDDEAKAVDMNRYYEIMKPGDVGRLWIKKSEQPLGCSEKMIVFIVELSENSGCTV